MLSYKNLPKGRLFNNMKFKNAFGINNKKENNNSNKNIQSNSKEDNYKLKKSNTILSLNMNKKEDMIDYMNKSMSDEYLSENYEDLFLYFLFETEKIDIFDEQKEFKNEKRINKKFTFFYIFQAFGSEDKIRWNNFLFPKSIYKLLYLKSRKMQKQIMKYSISTGQKVEDILNSYNPKYTFHKNVKNWNLKPKEAYKNYEEISLREKLEKDRVSNNGNPYLKNKTYTDFIIKTDNNGKGKTLLFLGKSFHLYIDDYDNYHKVQEHNGISMAIEESEFNKNTKNQIIYTVDELALKNKNNQQKNNNNYESDISKAKQIYQNKLKNNKLNSFKSNLNLNLKNKNSKKHLSMDSKRKNKTKIFDNQEEDKNDNSKLPLITKIKKPVINDKLTPKENNNTKTNKILYKNKFAQDNKIKGNKKLTPYNIYQIDKIPHPNKKIVNFFRKENSDFYY